MAEFKWPQDGSAGSGDVVGPASSTNNAVARFDGTTGKLLDNSGVIIDDSNNVTGVNDLTVAGDVDAATVTLPGGDVQAQLDDLQTDVDAKIPLTQKGAANGVATLGSDSKIPSAQLPAIAITDTFVVGSQAAMLALTAETGDVAVRTDLNKSFILAGTDPTVLADWQELLTPTDVVLSVNGQTGAVSLSTTNISEGSNLYFTDERAQDAVGTILADTSSVDFTYNDGANTISATVLPAGVDKNSLGGTALTIANGGTGQTSKTNAYDALSPNSTLGDVTYHDGTDNVRLAGNTTTTKKWLRQVGNGSVSAAPAWEEVDQVKGQTSGTAIGAGYVGEILSTTSTTAITTSAANLASLTLTPGVWTVTGNCRVGADSTGRFVSTSISTTSNTADSTLGRTTVSDYNTGTGVGSALTFPRTINVSVSTPVYLVGLASSVAGLSSTNSYLEAVRIA